MFPISSSKTRLIWSALAVLLIAVSWRASRHPVEVILAEAADQGLQTMTAVGEVIRERGSTKGFTVTRKNLGAFYRSQPLSCRLRAEIAWPLSAVTNWSRHATHFENTRLFGAPPWAGEMDLVLQRGDFSFYRQKRKRFSGQSDAARD